MKAVMYHYVRYEDSRLPYFKHLHLDDFKRQLDFFEREFGFVSKDVFFDSFESGVVDPGAVLTFDDGLFDHFEYVFPELTKRGLWGIFYVPCAIYGIQDLLDVHRIHILVGSRNGTEVLSALEGVIDDSMLAHEHISEFKTETYRYHDDEAATKRVKRILNYLIATHHRGVVLTQVMNKLNIDEESLTTSFYLSPENLKEMYVNGMLIGSHSMTHPVMSTLSRKEQHAQIADSFSCLTNILGDVSPKTFCSPYGGFHSFNADTEDLLKEEGCLFSFNVEPRDITSNDILGRPQALPRYDCNRFPHGKVR